MLMLVLSDTHGKLERAEETIRKYPDAQYIIHLGNDFQDAFDLERNTGRPVIPVAGNGDGWGLAQGVPWDRVLTTSAGKIFLTHGHRYGVKSGYEALASRAAERGCSAAFFGHTHQAVLTECGGITIFNPGSIAYPRDGSNGSYGVVEVQGDTIICHTEELGFETRP